MLSLTGIKYNGVQRGPWNVPDNIVSILNTKIKKFNLPAGLFYSIPAIESDFVPTAWNQVYPDNSVGLFQWNMVNRENNPVYAYNKLIDPDYNAELAGQWMHDNYNGKDWHSAAPTWQWGAAVIAFPLWDQWSKDGTLDKITKTIESGNNSGAQPSQPSGGGNGGGNNDNSASSQQPINNTPPVSNNPNAPIQTQNPDNKSEDTRTPLQKSWPIWVLGGIAVVAFATSRSDDDY